MAGASVLLFYAPEKTTAAAKGRHRLRKKGSFRIVATMSIRVQKEGILTTVQGLGVYGMQRFGINPSGAMDKTAVRLINLILRNNEDEPALEVHFPAGEMVFERPCILALGGADFHATLNGNSVENWCSAAAQKSSVLKFEQKASGNRCYVAVAGGFRTERHSTNLANFRLRKDDVLEFKADSTPNDSVFGRRISNSLIPAYRSFPTVRVVVGGEFDLLSATDRQTLIEETFLITNNSNRMGFRLHGRGLNSTPPAEMVSSAVTFGTIQLLPDGQLIILMADHQTSGGYPRIANVISADLPLVAQLGANDKLAFKLVDITEAERAAIQSERDIRRLRIGCQFGRYW